MVVAVFRPDLTIGLALPGQPPTLWSSAGLALLIMTGLAGALAWGIWHDRSWTQPLLPVAALLSGPLDGLRGMPLSGVQYAELLTVVGVLAAYVYVWPRTQSYYHLLATSRAISAHSSAI